MYCKVFRPKVRFHVCCRSFKSKILYCLITGTYFYLLNCVQPLTNFILFLDNENCFFCIELSEISPSRLSATREMLESKAKKNEVNQSGEI